MAKGGQELVFCSLGGAGEIGMNLNLFGYGKPGEYKWIIVDIGVTFSDDNIPGIEVILPNPEFIANQKENLLGIVLTHAHEDHVGAIAHLWPLLECPIYATPFTAAIVKEKFKELKINIGSHLKIVKLGGNVKLGAFDIDYVTLTHSILEPNGLAITTPEGVVLHTADWKIDEDPLIGEKTDVKKLTELGKKGVLAMVCDSTNIFNLGSSGSESLVRTGLLTVLEKMKNRIVITSFASNVARMETVFKVAEKIGRQVCLVGRSMNRIYQLARQCNYLQDIKVPIDVRDAKKIPKNKMVFLCTGSQGEQRAALARIANGTHPDLHLEKDDNVIFSSRIIPGNEKRLFKIFNDFSKNDINVLSEENSMIHVSGHPAREDLKKMYSWVKPKILIPVHGEQRHMAEHISFAKEMGVKFPVKVSNGEILRLAPGEPEVVDKVTWGRVYLDGKVLIDNDSPVLKERRNMAANGYMEITVLISKNGQIKNNPIVTLKGIPLIEEDASEIEYDLEDVVMDTCKTFNLNNSKQEKNLIDTLKGNCRKLINDKSGKKPLVNINLVRL
ncbi:MAG: ribonuclease J [Proteobacteria bacterium]|jgi:ribonuclease J|nr:ribonuclease J [Candidatus Fonsibacter lacus]NCU73791.1 ribonuclease J [Candidatus Fonsibacter lacus]NDF57579.1 ribonuclease J [Pseudomonadota bacterium]